MLSKHNIKILYALSNEHRLLIIYSFYTQCLQLKQLISKILEVPILKNNYTVYNANNAQMYMK